MIEFLILIGVGMFLVAIATSIIVEQSGDASQKRHERSVNEQYERVRSELLAATIAKDGYRTELAFTPPYRGVLMNLTIDDANVAIRSARTATGGTIPGVSGSVTLSNGAVTIEKIDGEVVVS